MTFSARITAASCLLALLAGFGSVRADPAECGGSVAGLPWPVFRSATDECLRNDPVVSLPWRVSRSTTGGCSKGRTVTGLPWWVSRSATGAPSLESLTWPDNCLGDCEVPVWTVTADALLLWRSPARSQSVLFAPAFNRPDVILLDVADLGFSFQPGPRIGLTRQVVNDCFLEVNFFGIDGWTSSAQRDGNPLALFPPGILVSSEFAVDYGSELYSTEVNLHRRFFGRLDLLAGLRWVELREDFQVVGPNPLAGVPDVRYDTLSDNSLYGFQIGVHDRVFNRGGPLQIDGFIKAGIYANNGHQETSTRGNLGSTVTAAARDDDTSFIGEAGLSAKYRLGDHLAVRGGYQVMWIEGVALAPDQMPHTDVTSSPGTATLDSDGGLFYHGCQVGIEAHW